MSIHSAAYRLDSPVVFLIPIDLLLGISAEICNSFKFQACRSTSVVFKQVRTASAQHGQGSSSSGA